VQNAAQPNPTLDSPSGARSSALLVCASVVAIGLNYVFLLAAGRILGSDDYGALAALLGLLTVVLLPTGALQLAVSREVSRRLALGDSSGAEAFSWAMLRFGLIATVPILVLAAAGVVPLKEILNLESVGIVALLAAALLTALVFPITIGVLQGYHRFHAVAAIYVLPFALRLGLLGLIAAAGFRLGGAVLATVLAIAASAAIAAFLAREPLRRGAKALRPALGPFLRYLWPVLVGLIGIALLTNIDLLVVRARFPSDEAGEYAAASAFARVAFFLPATILVVVFPRTAARQARGEDTADILGRSLVVTAAFGAVLTIFYAVLGRGLVGTSFGAEFAEGGELLVLFTISMTLFALANVFVGFHLSRAETRYTWIVAVAAALQLAILALVPQGPSGVIVANIVVGIALLAAHELLVGSSVPALRAGLERLWRGRASSTASS
jgi:O-antigen/teichoic acid export membrane protein